MTSILNITSNTVSKTLKAATTLALVLGTIATTTSEAGAVSLRVQMACASDYYAYCSQYSPGSSEVRQCMRANGLKLSSRCVNALIADGEVSQAEVNRRASLR